CPGMYCSSAPMDELDRDVLPNYCPMQTSPEIIESSIKRYENTNVKSIYVPSTITEGEAYQIVRGVNMAVRPRIKELIEFSKLLGIKKIGIVFCLGLKDEASRLTGFLEKQNFEVASVLCKCGGVDKVMLGVNKQSKIRRNKERFEAACNPILQAELLNRAGTEINVIVGLCIGHDILFTLNSKAPVTTLVVKDRLLGHNPVIALYSSYHRRVIESQERN
ncbi:unnamed protein product, partial [marine sediment metagenome]